jgi:hypothetical protein
MPFRRRPARCTGATSTPPQTGMGPLLCGARIRGMNVRPVPARGGVAGNLVILSPRVYTRESHQETREVQASGGSVASWEGGYSAQDHSEVPRFHRWDEGSHFASNSPAAELSHHLQAFRHSPCAKPYSRTCGKILPSPSLRFRTIRISTALFGGCLGIYR